MDKPNPLQTWNNLIAQIAADLENFGVAYIEVAGRELYALRPNNMKKEGDNYVYTIAGDNRAPPARIKFIDGKGLLILGGVNLSIISHDEETVERVAIAITNAKCGGGMRVLPPEAIWLSYDKEQAMNEARAALKGASDE